MKQQPREFMKYIWKYKNSSDSIEKKKIMAIKVRLRHFLNVLEKVYRKQWQSPCHAKVNLAQQTFEIRDLQNPV